MAFPTILDFSASFAHQILIKLIHRSCTLETGSAFTIHCLVQRIKFIQRAEENIQSQSVCKTLLHNNQLFSKRKSKSHGREQRQTRTLGCLSQSFKPCFWQLRESIPQEILGTCAFDRKKIWAWSLALLWCSHGHSTQPTWKWVPDWCERAGT